MKSLTKLLQISTFFFLFILKKFVISYPVSYNIVYLDEAGDLSQKSINNLQNLPYTQFTLKVNNSTLMNSDTMIIKYTNKNDKPNSTFISSNFVLDDITLSKDGDVMKAGQDFFFNLQVNDTIVPKSRFYSNSDELFNANNYTPDQINKTNVCNIIGGGINYLENTYSNQLFYDVVTFGTVAFSIFSGENGIKVKTIDYLTISYIDIDTYIKNSYSSYPNNAYNLEFPVNSIQFKNLIVSNQINIQGGNLIGVSAQNEIFIWNITQTQVDSNNMATFLKFYGKFTDLVNGGDFDQLNNVGFFNDYLIFGIQGKGIRIYNVIGITDNNINTINSASTNTDTTNSANVNSNDNNSTNTNISSGTGRLLNSNTYNLLDNGDITASANSNDYLTSSQLSNLRLTIQYNFNYRDLIVNYETLYVIQGGVGLKLFDMKDLSFSQQPIISNTNLQNVEYLETSLYSDYLYFIGVSALNSPANNNAEIFYEIIANEEYIPTINRVYVSSKTRNFDNFITNLNSFSVFFDKGQNELVFLVRGAPNVVDIPSFVIPLSSVFQSSLSGGLNPVHLLFDMNTFEPTYMVQNNNNYYSITNVRIQAYELVCNFLDDGQYNLDISNIYVCDSSDPNNIYNYCSSEIQTIFIVDYSKSGLVILLIVLLIILFLVIILLALYKYGIIFKKKGAENQQGKPTYVDPSSNFTNSNNNNKVEMGEIEINVQHEQLEDEK